jgi:hypothetical protein
VETNDIIRDQARKIAASGVLGRARSYARLLNYLVGCSERGHTPKEIEIAAEVFDKGNDFDPSQDSMVRVYAHNLRQKIKQFYDGEGRAEALQIAIPKGEYRVVAVTAEAETPPPVEVKPRAVSALALGLAAASILALGVAIGMNWQRAPDGASAEYLAVAASPIWSPLLDDRLPTLVVVGDYYIFGELDARGNVARLVREFSINSGRELEDYIMFEPEVAERYIDLDLTYLARSTAFAMRDVLRVLYTSDKPVRVVSMSELNAADLKANHIVYIGYISALDKLLDFVFSSSAFVVGDTFDELVNKQTKVMYTSEAGLPADYRNYRDYGLVSSFPGPSGNQFVIVAGTRDAGLMHSAQAMADAMHVRAAERALSSTGQMPAAFELLYEVTGFDRTNLDAMLVYAGVLDYGGIWGGELLLAD